MFKGSKLRRNCRTIGETNDDDEVEDITIHLESITHKKTLIEFFTIF